MCTMRQLQTMAELNKLADFEIRLKRKCLRVSSMIKLSGVFVLTIILIGISTIA